MHRLSCKSFSDIGMRFSHNGDPSAVTAFRVVRNTPSTNPTLTRKPMCHAENESPYSCVSGGRAVRGFKNVDASNGGAVDHDGAGTNSCGQRETDVGSSRVMHGGALLRGEIF